MNRYKDVPYVKLNNGVYMPQFGLGVWQAQEGEEVEKAVSTALEAGYRLIDTAAIYGNEAGVGKAIRESDVPREDIFVTTKLWNDSHDYDKALKAFEDSRKRLGLDYVDLYLIHWPVPAQGKFTEAWRALERLYHEKRVRAIGVSNFLPEHLDELLVDADEVPVLNQVELHPRLQQKELRDYCRTHGIKVESYSPIMRGGELLDDPTLQKIAEKYGKSVAQVILRWHVDSGCIVIPKSVNAERIHENFDIFDFQLDKKDLWAISELDTSERTGADPATANFT